MQPTAIGLTPPLGLLRATEDAAKKYGLAVSITSPLMTKLMKLVRDSNSTPDPTPVLPDISPSDVVA